jgi:hypothetical protein
MFSWWSELPSPLRYAVAILLLLISTGLWFAGRFWPWGWGAGTVLLFFAGPSDSEKNGYHF